MPNTQQICERLGNLLKNNGFSQESTQKFQDDLFTYFSTIVNPDLEEIMKTLKDLQDDVTAQKTITNGLKTLSSGFGDQLKSLADQIRALPTNDAQAISDLADQVESNSADIKASQDAIVKAVTDNTPAANP